MKQPRKIELLAPAGSFESLTAAIQSRADAVYFGVMQLNMRARSSHNFTLRDLRRIVSTCHKHNVKAYLALNTILYDHEAPLMRKIIDSAKKNGVDAVIASDWAVMDYARSVEMPVHASTQANVANTESVRHFARYADAVVLARELHLDQVKKIAKAIQKQHITGPSGSPVKLEVFIHGALCMAISGKCYLSLHQAGASANRGECMQLCRRSYIVSEKETGAELEIDNEFIMSPKDLCTIGFLDKIAGAGADILKIEGRGRSPEYVRTVTACYREAIDAVFNGAYTPEKIAGWQERLATVFNRGFWDGYYLGRRLGEWSDRYGSRATHRKVYVGRGSNYFPRLKVAEFVIEAKTLNVGDTILITGPTTGVIETTVQEIREEDTPVLSAKKGSRISIAIDRKIRRSDKLYKVVTAAV